MITVVMKKTGKKEIVTPNVAHDLIERGLAELVVKEEKPTIKDKQVQGRIDYPTRQMKAKHKK